MKNDWKQALYFTKSERNGLILLLLSCLGLFILPYLFTLKKKPPTPDFSSFQQEVNSFLSEKEEPIKKTKTPIAPNLFPFNPNDAAIETFIQLGLSEKVAQTIVNYRNKGGKFFQKEDFKKIYGISSENYQQLEPFIQIPSPTYTSKSLEEKSIQKIKTIPSFSLQPFDPNNASKEELINLGIPPKAANILINFRNKGGSFTKKEDLKKVFGITPKEYLRLEPYIAIPEKEGTKVFPKKEPFPPESRPKTAKIIIDINQSSAEDWQKLNGIGPGFSNLIINWRNKLGGFSSVEQIGETYGLPDSTFQKILPQLKVSPVLKLIPINEVNLEELKAHPYLNYKQAKAIIYYRKNHGPFNSFSDLENIYALPKETLNSVKPYFSF